MDYKKIIRPSLILWIIMVFLIITPLIMAFPMVEGEISIEFVCLGLILGMGFLGVITALFEIANKRE